jgi:hypothetical protein
MRDSNARTVLVPPLVDGEWQGRQGADSTQSHHERHNTSRHSNRRIRRSGKASNCHPNDQQKSEHRPK